MNEDLLVACVTLPMWFAPVTIDGDRYIDGVYLTDANLMEAIRRGADELWIIWTVSRKAQMEGRLHRHLLPDHRDDRQRASATRPRSHRSQQQGDRRGQERGVRPADQGGDAGGGGAAALPRQRRLARVHRRRRAGHRRCAGLVPGEGHHAGRRQRKQDLMALTFSETMQGPFALGVTDPEEGRRRGLAEGTSLALHGNIRIDAFDRFVNQADHAGSLTGTVDFNASPFGKGMAASRGVFNLFNPGGKGKERPQALHLRGRVRAQRQALLSRRTQGRARRGRPLEGHDDALHAPARRQRRERQGRRRGRPDAWGSTT